MGLGLNRKFLLVVFLIALTSSSGWALIGVLPFCNAQTYNEVNGMISSNVTLTKENGPYQFGQVVVNLGATLTIEAGSSVNIEGYLRVNGTLIAKGSSDNRIYFSGGYITFTSTSGANSIIENAVLMSLPVYISGSVTIKNSYLQGGQASTTITINDGSPTISYNTLKGTLDSASVIYIGGGSPTISNNNIIAYVDNGLYPNPPADMNRFGSAYGVHATNVNGAIITNNKFYLPFRTASVQVDSGTATVEGNSEYPGDTVAFPTPTPPPPTPTPEPTPTLPPYPPPESTPTSTSPSAQPTNTPENEGNLYETVIAVIIASVIINAFLVATVALLLKRTRKKQQSAEGTDTQT